MSYHLFHRRLSFPSSFMRLRFDMKAFLITAFVIFTVALAQPNHKIKELIAFLRKLNDTKCMISENIQLKYGKYLNDKLGFEEDDLFSKIVCIKQDSLPSLDKYLKEFSSNLPNNQLASKSLQNEFQLAELPKAWSLKRLFRQFTKSKKSELYQSADEFKSSLETVSSDSDVLVLRSGNFRKEFYPDGMLKLFTDGEKFEISRQIVEGKSIVTYQLQTEEKTKITYNEVKSKWYVLNPVEDDEELLFGNTFDSQGKIEYFGYFNATSLLPSGLGCQFLSPNQMYFGEFNNGLFHGAGLITTITAKKQTTVLSGISTEGNFVSDEDENGISHSLNHTNIQLAAIREGEMNPLIEPERQFPWATDRFLYDYIQGVIRPKGLSSAYVSPFVLDGSHNEKVPPFLDTSIKGFDVFDWYDEVHFPAEFITKTGKDWDLFSYDNITGKKITLKGKGPKEQSSGFSNSGLSSFLDSMKNKFSGNSQRRSVYLSEHSSIKDETENSSIVHIIFTIQQYCQCNDLAPPTKGTLSNLSKKNHQLNQEIRIIEEYLKAFPNSEYADYFKARVEELGNLLSQQPNKDSGSAQIVLNSFRPQFKSSLNNSASTNVKKIENIPKTNTQKSPKYIITIHQSNTRRFIKTNTKNSVLATESILNEQDLPAGTIPTFSVGEVLSVNYHRFDETNDTVFIEDSIIEDKQTTIQSQIDNGFFKSAESFQKLCKQLVSTIALLHRDFGMGGIPVNPTNISIDKSGDIFIKGIVYAQQPEPNSPEQTKLYNADWQEVGNLLFSVYRKYEKILNTDFLLQDFLWYLIVPSQDAAKKPSLNHPYFTETVRNK